MTAFKADPEHRIPWPVVLLLGAFSRKHIFSNAKAISMLELHRACRDFGNRVKWKCNFRHTRDNGSPLDKNTLPLVSRRPREYRGCTTGAVNNFIAAVTRTVHDFGMKASS